jgi:hypothetical protein
MHDLLRPDTCRRRSICDEHLGINDVRKMIVHRKKRRVRLQNEPVIRLRR